MPRRSLEVMGKSSHFQAEIPVYNLETRPKSAIVESQMKRIMLFVAVAGLAVWITGCSQLNPGAGANSTADREADERTIRNLDADWSKAAWTLSSRAALALFCISVRFGVCPLTWIS